jgi:hypothetical protein
MREEHSSTVADTRRHDSMTSSAFAGLSDADRYVVGRLAAREHVPAEELAELPQAEIDQHEAAGIRAIVLTYEPSSIRGSRLMSWTCAPGSGRGTASKAYSATSQRWDHRPRRQLPWRDEWHPGPVGVGVSG